MELRVVMTGEDVEKGRPGGHACPVALALTRAWCEKRQLGPERVDASVGAGTVCVTEQLGTALPESRFAPLPGRAMRFISRFDAGAPDLAPLGPFRLRLL